MKKIAMVVFSSFPIDVRVRREAEAHIEIGNQVDVFCRTSRGEAREEIVNNIQIYRLKLKRERAGKISYILEYLYFFTWALFKLTSLFFKNKYDVIHIHNMPDFLVFTAIVPKLLGRKIILDLHDPMPELYMSMFSMAGDNPLIRFLKLIEKICIKYADHIITPNVSFRNLFISRGCSPDKISIVMNSPDEKIFNSNNKIIMGERDKDFVIMYHGAVVERQGPDILVTAVSMIRNKIPGLKVLIYGEGNFLEKVKLMVSELNLSEIVKIKGMVIVDKIAEAIRGIDLGVIPNRSNPFTQINFPVRTFEYLVMNKPVIVPETQGIMDYFCEGSIFFFKPGDSESLAKTILEVYENPENTKLVLDKSLEVFNNYRWQFQKEKLIDLTNHLFKN
jgi:glycosyltransferase involved in cell wall biosynthesis